MTTLPDLKAAFRADHNGCPTCGKYSLHQDGIHTCHQHPFIATLTSAKAADEKRIGELEAQLSQMDEAMQDIWQEVELPLRISVGKGGDAWVAAHGRILNRSRAAKEGGDDARS